jgi:hypothetical protein
MTREGANDSLLEVSKMNINAEVDSWVAEEELPVHAGLKVVRLNSPNYCLTDDEIKERNEFIHWYLMQDFKLLMIIPAKTYEDDFFIGNFTPEDEEYNAFNTVDFQRTLQPFDKYGYAMKKIMERIQDLALLHSVIASQEDRQATYRRYEGIVEIEFRDRLMALVSRYQTTGAEHIRSSLKQKIAEISRRILEAKKIWEQYAPRDT